MNKKRTLPDVLDKVADIAQRHSDGVSFRTDETSDCIFCFVNPDTDEHELWCAWKLGRTLSQSDIVAIKRLARVLRYEV